MKQHAASAFDRAVLVLNTGGTFNKRYDPIGGDLFVARDDQAVEAALAQFRGNLACRVQGLIYKDSLEMDEEDRALLAREIAAATETHVLVVHGTDTMSLSADAVAKCCPEKRIVFSGAMTPYAFAPQEGAMNLALGMGWLLSGDTPEVRIAMHGLVLPYAQIVKDRQNGVFVALE
ncbi:MAG: asparaginase domain-containing protein [Pseudomonadota bacterium]